MTPASAYTGCHVYPSRQLSEAQKVARGEVQYVLSSDLQPGACVSYVFYKGLAPHHWRVLRWVVFNSTLLASVRIDMY